jgi:hypothetical protein
MSPAAIATAGSYFISANNAAAGAVADNSPAVEGLSQHR